MTGWAWSGTSASATGCGISQELDESWAAARLWLAGHPDGLVVFGQVRLTDGSDILAALRSPHGTRLVSDHRHQWAEVSATYLAASR